MAPEQLAGGAVDARSDQFAFAVSAWQALCGGLPFQPDAAGKDAFERMLLAIHSRRRMRAADARVPARIVKVLVRGLEPEPAARWPSLVAMLDALERSARPRTRYVLLAALLVIAAAAAAVALKVTSADDGVALLPTRASGARSKALGPLIAASASRPIDAAAVAASFHRAFERSGTPIYLREQARAEIMATNPNLAGFDCRGLATLASYRALAPDDSLDATFLTAFGILERRCKGEPQWTQTDNLQEIEAAIAAAIREGDPTTVLRATMKLRQLQPDEPGLWRRVGDAYVGAGFCVSARKTYDHYLAIVPKPEPWRAGIATDSRRASRSRARARTSCARPISFATRRPAARAARTR